MSHNVTSVGQICTGNPGNVQLHVSFRYHSTEHMGAKAATTTGGDSAQHRPGASQNVIFNVPESYRSRQPKLDNFTVPRRDSNVRAFRNGHVFFWTPDHVQPHTKTEHQNWFLAVSFEAKVELCWYCCCSKNRHV